jgi:hypothetical protein
VPSFVGSDARACELTTRGTPLGATTGRSQARAPFLRSLSTAAELAALVCPQGCAPTRSALSPAGGPVATSAQADTASRQDHEHRNPRGRAVAERKKRRRVAYELREGLRPLNAPRIAACGRKRIAFEVEVVRRLVARRGGGTSQHAHYRGLLRCGSVWECPVCGRQIRAARAEELKFAVEAWGASNVAMLSLTVRHGLGDDLREVRRGLADGFRGLINGKPWKKFRAKFGIEHQVRAVEVTRGAHGWHPHLHVLFFLEVPLTREAQRAASLWLRERWMQCVRRALGSEFVPNEHGVDLRGVWRPEYLAKLSFELTDPGTKRGRRKGRTPFQIATSAASGNCPADESLWVAYCEGMRGAKMLTWSRGLREFVGLDAERNDGEIVDGEEQAEAETVAVIAGGTWDSVRNQRGLPCAILEAAELAAGAHAGFEAIQNLVRICGPLLRLPREGPR